MHRIILALFFFTLLVACDTKLSEDQRRALREEMDNRKIKKIGQEDIYREALAQGRKIAKGLNIKSNVDSVQQQCRCTITIAKDSANLSVKEKEVFAAYKFAPDGTDNIQKDQLEYLIYTKPHVQADTLGSLLLIRFNKKEIVKSL